MQTLLLFMLVANLCVIAAAAVVWAREMLQSGAETSAMKSIDEEREEIEKLLPWHAAGTLTPRDAKRVAKAVAGDRKLAQRCNLVREELNETILLNETLGAPSALTGERLFATIDAEPARKTKTFLHLTGRSAKFISRFSPRALAWVGSAAVLVIVLQEGVIAVMVKNMDRQKGVELASAGVTDASLAMIRFVAKADAADITQFLAVNKVTVVEGPKSGGLYTIRLPVAGQQKKELIKQMQAQSGIVEFIATVR